jgi:hypothetical protein
MEVKAGLAGGDEAAAAPSLPSAVTALAAVAAVAAVAAGSALPTPAPTACGAMGFIVGEERRTEPPLAARH